MDIGTFPRGVLLGLSIAAPVGPIGLLVIRRTLAHGFRIGFATGLGAAFADTCYGLIAAFGLTAIMSTLVDHADLVRLLGGAALILIGARGVQQSRRHAQTAAAATPEVPAVWGVWAQAVGLTLTNPATILSFIAMFAGVGVVEPGANVRTALLLVAGVAIGSACWWVFLCSLTTAIRGRISDRTIRLINLTASWCIIGFGIVALVAALR